MSAFSNMYSPGGGGVVAPSSGAGGFFSNIYQNVVDTYTVAEESNQPGWWQQTLTQVGNIAATIASTKLAQAKNAGLTPVNVPQHYPGGQTEFPSETTRGPYQMAVSVGGKKESNNLGLLAVAGIAAFVLLRK